MTPPPDTTPRQTNLTLNIKTTDQVVMEVASKVEEATRPYVIRIEAGLGVMGDVSGITAGGALIAAPEPTTATKVGGAYLVMVSVDSLQAHVRILISGEPTATVLHQAIQAGLTKLGMDEGEAETAASTVDLGNQVLQAYHGAMSFPEAPGQFASGQILRPLDEMTAGRLNPSNYQLRLNASRSTLGSNGGNVQLQFRFMAGESGVARYEVDTFGNLRSRSLPGDGLALDHQPSNAANIARAEAELGRKSTPAERATIRNQGTAVAVPQEWHQSGSLTYGGRNTPAQIRADALNPQSAALRDSQAMIDGASAADRAAAEAAAARIRQNAGGQ